MLIPAAIPWIPPIQTVEALVFTSPQAPRLAGAAADRFKELPTYAVGERTAVAARDAGFVRAVALGGKVEALFASLVLKHRRVLHLAGAERTEAPWPEELEIIVRSVYQARLAPLTELAANALRAGAVDWVLLFSARSAAQFAAQHDALGLNRSKLGIGAISRAALAAAGTGWGRMIAAAEPSEAGILAACGLSCDNASTRSTDA